MVHWLIHSLTGPLVKSPSKHSESQTGRARELQFWENDHPTLCVTCHLSCVTCHLSHITCNLSRVKKKTKQKKKLLKKRNTKKIKFFYLEKKLDKVVELVGGGSVINGAYPVLFMLDFMLYPFMHGAVSLWSNIRMQSVQEELFFSSVEQV